MSVSNRAFPDVSCVLYSNAQTPFPVASPLILCDVLSGTLVPFQGDGIGLDNAADLNPNISGEWYRQPAYASAPTGLHFVRFKEDGTVVIGAKPIPADGKNDFAGWALQPRVAWMDARIGSNATLIDGDLTDLNWSVITGMWKTVTRLKSGFGTALYCTGTGSVWKARTVGTIPKSRSLCFEISLIGQTSDEERAVALVSWGGFPVGEFRLVWKDGSSIGLDKRIATGGTDATDWQRLISFDSLPPASFADQKYFVGIMRIAGRMVITINGRGFWYLEQTVSAGVFGSKSTTQDVRAIDVTWGTGKLNVVTANGRARVGVGVIKYTNAAGVKRQGEFTRITKRTEPLPTGDLEISIGGWQKAGATATIATGGGVGAFTYTCTLVGGDDGIDTPFVSKVNIYKGTTYTNPVASSLEVRGAIESIRVNQSIPSRENSTGTTATVELDMVRLRQISADMLNFATSYRTMEIKARWEKSDGTFDTDYTPLFQGHVTAFSDNLPGFATHTRTLRGRDATCQLQAPAGFIDHRYPPMDIFFARKAGVSLGNSNQVPNPATAVLFGWEMVKEMLRIEKGDAFANSLQVFLPSSHYPILSYAADRCGYLTLLNAFGNQAPTENGFMLPAPYKSHLWDWIQQIADLDRAAFFLSFPQNDRTAWPVPTYARVQHWLRQPERATWVAPDNLYAPEMLDFMMESLSMETRPDRDYNHFFAASSPPSKDMGGFMPGLRMSEDFIRTGRNTAAKSWRRTLDIQNDLAWIGGAGMAGVDALVKIARQELEGVNLIWPQVTVPGEPTMAPGDKMTIQRTIGLTTSGDLKGSYASPAGYDGFSAVTTRITNLEHEINLGKGGDARRWRTKVDLRPQLSSGV